MPKRPKHYENNEAFMAHLMKFCPTGALSHVMIMQAVEQFAKAVAEADVKDLGQSDGFVSPEAWKQTGEYIANEFKQYYASR